MKVQVNAVILAALIVAQAKGGIIDLGGTDADSLEFARAGVYPQNPSSLKEVLDRLNAFVTEHPGNKAGRIARASFCLELGQLASARSDLNAVAQAAPDYRGLAEAKFRLGEITGAVDGQMEAYQSLLKALESKPELRATAPDVWEVRARLLELQHDIAGAERALDQLAIAKGKQAYLIKLGEFHMRQEKYREAATDYASFLKTLPPDDQMSKQFVPGTEMRLAMALWAANDRNAAADHMLNVIELLDSSVPDARSITGLGGTVALYAKMLVLSGASVAPADVKRVQSLLDDLKAETSKGPYYDVALIYAVDAGKIERKEALDQLSAIITVAPNLEFPLWSLAYLAMTSPSDADRILKLIPEHKMQHSIVSEFIKSNVAK
jgi:tetratricopeptide (TPR) repeat protein